MASVPIKRGQTEEEIEHYYFLLELRAKKDFDLSIAANHFCWRESDNPNRIKCCEYGRLGFEAAAAVVHPLIMVYNYIYRYHRNHTPWESIPIPTKNYPLLGPHDVYNCLLKLSRENQELFLRQFAMTNRQRDGILMSLLPTGYGDEFEAVYGDLSNAQEMSNLCWELGLYHPDEDDLILSRILEMPELYDKYLNRTRIEDWEEIEHIPITNLVVLNRVQDYYDDYCEGRRLIKENGDYINKKEKEIINEILMRPEGELFRSAYEAGIVHLIEYDAVSLVEVNIEDYTITSCPPFDDIEWEVDKEPFPFGIKVQHRSTSQPIAQPDAQQSREDGKPETKPIEEEPKAEEQNRNEQKKRGRKELPPIKFSEKTRRGRKEGFWMVKRYNTPEIRKAFAKNLKPNIWDPLFAVLEDEKEMVFPESLKQESTYNALCASLIFHAAELSGIARVRYIGGKKKHDQDSEVDYDEESTVPSMEEDVAGVFDEAQDMAIGLDSNPSVKAKVLAGLENKDSQYGKIGKTGPTPKYALVFPVSYEATLSSIGVSVGHGTPRPFLKMLNHWLPEYLKAEERKRSMNEEERELEDDAAAFLRDHNCKKDIQSKQELLKNNLHKLSELLDKLKENLPAYLKEPNKG